MPVTSGIILLREKIKTKLSSHQKVLISTSLGKSLSLVILATNLLQKHAKNFYMGKPV